MGNLWLMLIPLFIAYDIANNHCEEKENKHKLKNIYPITEACWSNIRRPYCHSIANSIIKSLCHTINTIKEAILYECYKRERDGYFKIIDENEYQSPRYIYRRFAVNLPKNVFANPELEYIK